MPDTELLGRVMQTVRCPCGAVSRRCGVPEHGDSAAWRQRKWAEAGTRGSKAGPPGGVGGLQHLISFSFHPLFPFCLVSRKILMQFKER